MGDCYVFAVMLFRGDYEGIDTTISMLGYGISYIMEECWVGEGRD